MNNEWEKFGKEIRNIVDDAVSSQNFQHMNQTITDSVNEAISGFQKGLKTAGQAVNDMAKPKQKKPFWTPYQYNKRVPEKVAVKQELVTKKEERLDLFRKNTGLKIGGTVLSVLGYTFSGGIGITILILCLVALGMGSFPIGLRIAIFVLMPFFMGSGLMAWKGSNILSSLKRYQGYISELQGKTYCDIRQLADHNGKSLPFVQKDVQKMIHKGWFKQGHFDSEITCLIVSHDTYQEYQQVKAQRMEQKLLEEKQVQEKQIQEEGQDLNSGEFGQVLEEGRSYLQKIQECNQLISGQEISSKITRMEMLVQKIFDRVKEDPDSLPDIHKLMEYYLPTTVKLLEAYLQLDSQPVQGENIKSSKLEIEQTLDTLNSAFERLLDSLFEDVAWDVSTDISVLQAMLAQEGLAGNDFET